MMRHPGDHDPDPSSHVFIVRAETLDFNPIEIRTTHEFLKFVSGTNYQHEKTPGQEARGFARKRNRN